MTLRFCSLGSGSRGNALLIESGSTLLMIDCGLSRRAIETRMAAVGRSPADLTALLITHEHGDHCQGIGPLIGRYATRVWMTPGTARAIAYKDEYEALSPHRDLSIGSIEVEPFPVPHDAREPCQFVFRGKGRRLGLLTDTGHVTPHIAERLGRCDMLALEFNHDLESLMSGSYPQAVKQRVASRFGHLSNAQAAGLLAEIESTRLQRVIGLHLSERNNKPSLVHESVAETMGRTGFVFDVAAQDAPSAWLEIE